MTLFSFKNTTTQAFLYALGAIVMWSSAATLGVKLAHVPPFLLTGLALMVGAVPALPFYKHWSIPIKTLAVGIYGLFGFHFLLFMALRLAPPVQANLINYLWPLLIVLLAPLIVVQARLHWQHVVAAIVGFCGAAIAILSASGTAQSFPFHFSWGYVLALGAAFTWSSYTLLMQRLGNFHTAAIGAIAFISGVLSLLLHAFFEPSVSLSIEDGVLIALMGLGPLGAAFFLWDAAFKRGNPSHLGLLSFLTPILSTILLLITQNKPLSGSIFLSLALIIAAAFIGRKA